MNSLINTVNNSDTKYVYRSTQANQREEEYKNQIKTLTTRLKEVWNEQERFFSECFRTLANCIVRTCLLV